jgi:hypothetical protein
MLQAFPTAASTDAPGDEPTPLAIAQRADPLVGADAQRVQRLARLHAPDLRDRHEQVEAAHRLDRVDLDRLLKAHGLLEQLALDFLVAGADLVGSAQSGHALFAAAVRDRADAHDAASVGSAQT